MYKYCAHGIVLVLQFTLTSNQPLRNTLPLGHAEVEEGNIQCCVVSGSAAHNMQTLKHSYTALLVCSMMLPA